MSKEITTKQENSIIPMDAGMLLSKAVESNASVETMERLLAMRKELKQEQAREQYFIALSAFQGACPTITKSKVVKAKNGDVRYKYATLDDIVKSVSSELKANGLSYSIKTEPTQTGVKATCEIHHIMGHTESSSFEVPIDKEAFMSDAQKAGSAQSYAKRYALCNALGILTSDEDTDGQYGNQPTPQEMYKRFSTCMAAVLDLYPSIMAIKEAIASNQLERAVEAWEELSRDERQSIWVAPTKGGPFTTEEVKVIRSDEWYNISQQYHTTESEKGAE